MILSYLENKDLEKIDRINEIDALIFHLFVYIPLEYFIKENEQVTISEAYQRYKREYIFSLSKQEDYFFELLSKNMRYKDLYIKDIISKIDYEKEEQFMAMTILLPNDFLYVVYRGTTKELVAWKEDLNMSYMVVPAQKDALTYLNQVDSNKRIYVGGHSKGGNLAMYAAINAKEEINKKIIKVFNYDGPGFIMLDTNYERNKNKIVSYIPSDSIVGRLFKMNHKRIVVKSDAKGIEQHDLYRWHMKDNTFVLSNLSIESKIIKRIVDTFFSMIDLEEWSCFVNTTYQILTKIGITSVEELNFNDIKDIIFSYRNMDEEKKKLLLMLTKHLFHVTQKN